MTSSDTVIQPSLCGEAATRDRQPGARFPRPDGGTILVLVAALLAWSLPLSSLGTQSLWWDETWTWFQASQSLPEVIGLAIDIEPHPPLHPLLVHALIRWAGDSEFVLRIGSAAAGPLLVAGGFALTRRFSLVAAHWAAWLLAVAAFPVSYAQQARSYALAAALAVIAAAAFERAWREPRGGRVAVFALAVLGAFYLHVLTLLPMAGYCCGRLLLERRIPRWLWAATAGVVIGAAPWLVLLIRHTLQPAVPRWREAPSLDYLIQQSAAWLLIGPFQGVWPGPVVWLVAAIMVFALLAGLRGRARTLTLPAMLAAFGSSLLLGLVSLASPIFHERYLGLFAPFVLIAAAGGLASVRRLACLPGAVLWLAGAAGSLALVTGSVPVDDLRSVVRDLGLQARPGDVIILNPGWARLALDYYGDGTFGWAGFLGTAEPGSAAGPRTARIPVVGVGFLDVSPGRPNEIYPVTDWASTEGALAALGSEYERIWLFRLSDTISDPRGRVVDALETRWEKVSEQTYPGSAGARLRLFRTPVAYDFGPETAFHRRELPVDGFGQLLGWRWREPSANAPNRAILQIAWQVNGPESRNLRTFVHVLDDNGQRVGGQDIVTGSPVPPARWRSGDIILDEAEFEIPDPTLSWPVRIGLYDAASGQRLHLGSGEQVNPGLTPVRADFLPPEPLSRFANGLEIRDARVLSDTVMAGGGVQVRLTWQIDGAVPADTTVFVHLVDSSGRLLAQADGPIAGSGVGQDGLSVPTLVGEERRLTLPADLPLGEYQVLVGLYRSGTGERIQIMDPAGRPNALPIGAVRVAPLAPRSGGR